MPTVASPLCCYAAAQRFEEWITSWGLAAGMHQGVAHLEFTDDQLTLVRELRSADLSCTTYRSTARLERGQIVTEHVQHVSTTSARTADFNPSVPQTES